VVLAQRIQGAGEAEDVAPGVGEVDIVCAGLKGGAGERIVAVLEGARGVGHQPWRHGRKLGQVDAVVERQCQNIRDAAVFAKLAGQCFGASKVPTGHDQSDVINSGELTRQPAAEDAGRTDEQDAMPGHCPASGVTNRARNSGGGAMQELRLPIRRYLLRARRL
jgi:hypothetical protein